MEQLRTKAIKQHIEENYANSLVYSCFDKEKNGLTYYTYDQLSEVDNDWYPLCCYRDPKTKQLVYGGKSKIYHTYTEGETGAGKTTRLVMQSIKALSQTKNKPSFVIVDIHGEIIENMYLHFIKQGYNVKILNCDKPLRSDTYNPFHTIAESCLENKEIDDIISNRIAKIAEIMQPVQSEKDPIWDIGARAYTNGLILDKFEDLLQGTVDKKNITIYNIIQSHYWLRKELAETGSRDILEINNYRKKGSRVMSVQKMMAVTNNAERTRDSYFGVVENHFDSFGQTTLYELSSNNTIDIKEFIEKPTVIVIQSGTTTVGDALVSLLMNDLYTTVVQTGKKKANKKLNREIHCYLDEFANCNIAQGHEFISMLTTSRKFGLHWHMILQCDAQLDSKFKDANIGKIIRANCTEIFMGSHDYETMNRFATSCGQKTIESLQSKINKQMPSLEIVNLITPDKLYLIPEGYMYIRSNKSNLLYSYFEPFYTCKEFEAVKDIDSVYPYNRFNYKSTICFPGEGKKKVQPLNAINPEVKLDYILDNLKWVKADDKYLLTVDLPDQELENKIFPEKDLMYDEEEKDNQISDSLDDFLISYELEAHVKNLKTNIDFDEITCIPESIKKFLRGVNKAYDMLDHNLLVQEIIEAFVSKHEFKTKEEWNNAITIEVKKIDDQNIVQKGLLEYFTNAQDEIINMTLEEIYKMKNNG